MSSSAFHLFLSTALFLFAFEIDNCIIESSPHCQTASSYPLLIIFNAYKDVLYWFVEGFECWLEEMFNLELLEKFIDIQLVQCLHPFTRQ